MLIESVSRSSVLVMYERNSSQEICVKASSGAAIAALAASQPAQLALDHCSAELPSAVATRSGAKSSRVK